MAHDHPGFCAAMVAGSAALSALLILLLKPLLHRHFLAYQFECIGITSLSARATASTKVTIEMMHLINQLM